MDIDTPPNPIDTLPGHGHTHGQLPLPEFSASFPLPFRVLFLIGLGIFLWAINLHILSWIGLDVPWILDFRERDDDRAVDGLGLGHIGSSNGTRRGVLAGEAYGDEGIDLSDDQPATYDLTSPHIASTMRISSRTLGMEEEGEARRLYAPVYKLFLLYSAFVGGGWALFTFWTAGEPELMERYRGAVGVLAVMLVITAGLGLGPWSRVGERECAGLKR